MIHSQQADFRAGEREVVDAGELVTDEAFTPRIGRVMEAVGRREEQLQFARRWLQLLGRDEAGKDHETVFTPRMCSVSEVHPAQDGHGECRTQPVSGGRGPDTRTFGGQHS